jgi:TonB family protein
MIFAEPARERRLLGLGLSLTIHAGAFFVLLGAPALRLPRPSETPSEFRQKIEGRENKIVWYKLRKELPRITPSKPAEKRPLRAERLSKQAIISSPKNAPKREVMVWTPTPAPQIAPPPVEMPNLIAVKLPDPPPAVRKQFVAPLVQPTAPPAARALLAENAPSIEAASAKPLNVLNSKLPPKQFTPPSVTSQRAVPKEIVAADAPTLGSENALNAQSNLAMSKLPPRPFAAPPVARTSGKGIDTSASAEGAPDAPDLNVAVVGLNPIDKMAGALPSAPSPGAFAAGPVVRPNGASSEGDGKGIQIPSLFVKGPHDTKPDLVAQAFQAPTSEANLRAAMRAAGPATIHTPVPAEAALPSGAVRVSNAPDPRFNGREVFMMAIQMPQLTSYSGSWLMWYADRTRREAGLAPIAPPEAHRKVDPKYIASAVAERLEGRVTLACVIDRTGRVVNVELVRGFDDRLNHSAEEALAKWEFYPATRSGVPVDVDVVVEIPFRLQAKIERR